MAPKLLRAYIAYLRICIIYLLSHARAVIASYFPLHTIALLIKASPYVATASNLLLDLAFPFSSY